MNGRWLDGLVGQQSVKRGFNRSLGVDLETQLDYEEELQREAGGTADYAEGVHAFLEKRKPVFTGR